MHPSDALIPVLKKLRLSGVLQSLDLRVRHAADYTLAPSEFLYRLLTDEVERREAKQPDTRLRRANFEHAKTIEEFDFTFNPTFPKAKLLELATCVFVARRENALPRRPDRRREASSRPSPRAPGLRRQLQRPLHGSFSVMGRARRVSAIAAGSRLA
jgi:hypothetical protein